MKTKMKQGLMPAVLTLLLLAGAGTAVWSRSPQAEAMLKSATKTAPEVTTSKSHWLNTDEAMPHLFGKNGLGTNRVTVLTFWTHGCINCKRTVGFWNDWSKRYKDDVSVVSVHTPEADFERNPANVKRFVKQKGIIFPVVTDNDYAIWNSYGVKAWPTTILIDKQGKIRARWEGELNYDNSGEYKKVEATIDALRQEK